MSIEDEIWLLLLTSRARRDARRHLAHRVAAARASEGLPSVGFDRQLESFEGMRRAIGAEFVRLRGAA